MTATWVLAAPAKTASDPAAIDEFAFTDPFFEQIGDSETIPYGVAMTLAQDVKGLLWIGTQAGLIRYDGYRFRKFVKVVGDPTSLTDNYISALNGSADGRMWIGTNGAGLSVFDPRTERFTNFQHDPGRADSLAAGPIHALISDVGGGLWIGTEGGLDYLPAGSASFTHFRQERQESASLSDHHIRSLLIDSQGTLWIGTTTGLQQRRRDGRGFEPVASATPLAGQEILSLFEAKDGKLWIGTRADGAAWLEPDRLRLHRLAPDPANRDGAGQFPITAIAQPLVDQIWLGANGGGLTVVAADDGRPLRQLNHDVSIASSLAHNRIGALLMDRGGLLLVGTWGGGLQRYNPRSVFRLLRHSPARPRGLSHSDVGSILELDDGRLAFGTHGTGVDIMDRRRGLIASYRPANGDSGSSVARRIDSVVQMPDGTLWLGARDGGAQRLAPGARQWQTYLVEQGLPDIDVRRIMVDRRGRVWVGTAGGLARWRPERQAFETVMTENGGPLRAVIVALAEDAQERLWVGCNNGLWVVEPGSDVLRGIQPEPQRAASISANRINGLLVDRQGRLWVDTAQGLDRLLGWDGQRADFEHISALAGRPGLYFGANLLEDELGRIWTQWHVLDPQRMQIYDLSKADGLDIGTAWIGSYARTRDGFFIFGGTQGAAIVDPNKFQPWILQPRVVATELKIDGAAQPVGLLDRGLSLSPEQRNFSVEFAALDYSAPQKLRYAYRLLGYDKAPIEVDAEHRSASYGNLPPGKYTLQIKGSDRVGQWSPHELQVPIEVLPAWHQTIAFRTLAGLVLLAAVYGLIRTRTAVLRSRQIVLERQVSARTAELQARQQDLLEANDSLHRANDELSVSAETLRQLGEIGREITANLDAEAVFDALYRHVQNLMHAPTISIYRIGLSGDTLERAFGREDGKPLPLATLKLDNPASNAARSARERIEVLNETAQGKISATHVPGTRVMLTALFAPLIANDRVLGVMSVQSDREHAYGERERGIFRTLCAYGAIALANAEAQAQLIQSEKMASLGQLVANVAHEINTPIAAVKSSGRSIADALDELQAGAPSFALLDQATRELFGRLVSHAKGSPMRSTREERAIVREVSRRLDELGIADAQQKAGLVVQLNAHGLLDDYLPLLRHAESSLILTRAFAMATLINSAGNINTAADRVSKIVFALKAYSRSDSRGEMSLSSLQEGIETVLTIYHNQIKQGVELIRRYEDLPPIRCLPDELNQVWTNLVHNALQAMNYAGVLTVGIRRAGGEAVVSIADNGSGIPAEIRARIFEPFFTTKAAGEGSGLGLDIVKKIVDKHGGRVEVESTIGVGTTFSVHLPFNG